MLPGWLVVVVVEVVVMYYYYYHIRSDQFIPDQTRLDKLTEPTS